MERLAIVEEHVRLENAHDLEGIMGTFGADARYDDEPWDEHHLGQDQVRNYYQNLLRVAPDLKTEVKNRHMAGDAVILEGSSQGHTEATGGACHLRVGSLSSRYAEFSPLVRKAGSPANASTTTGRPCFDNLASFTSRRRWPGES